MLLLRWCRGVQYTRRDRACSVGRRSRSGGPMLGIPMWCTPSVPTAVRFYKDVVQACLDMCVCVYAKSEAFRSDLPPSFGMQASNIPQVISAKYIGFSGLLRNLEVIRGKIWPIPIELDYVTPQRGWVTTSTLSGAAVGAASPLRPPPSHCATRLPKPTRPVIGPAPKKITDGKIRLSSPCSRPVVSRSS